MDFVVFALSALALALALGALAVPLAQRIGLPLPVVIAGVGLMAGTTAALTDFTLAGSTLAGSTLVSDCPPDFHCLPGLGNIMDAQELHPLRQTGQTCCDRPGGPIARFGHTGQGADKTLARRPQHHRTTEPVEQG